MSGALELAGVHYAYDGVDVVRGVDLMVESGEIVCLLGPSGCGKTTCLRIAAGLERLNRGAVRIAGETVAAKGLHVPPERRHVGLVLQDFALFPHMTVAANVAFGITGHSKSAASERARGLLKQVGLIGYADAYPHQLSGGQQQRVALARALAPGPDVMLMDEPFSGLDVTLRGEVREKTVEVLKERGVPTLIVTHDPEEALAVADRIAIMRDGRIVQAGSAEEVYLRPENPFVMTFFGAPNSLTGIVKAGSVDTPFGPVPAEGLEEGERADVFFRGSALAPAATGGVPVEIADARLLGPVQRVTLRLCDDGRKFIMEHARRNALRVGERLSVAADPAEFHLFPATERQPPETVTQGS